MRQRRQIAQGAVRGFSYIEILITVAILALLATAAAPYVELTMVRQKETQLRRDLRQIREAIDAYKKASDEGRIPKELGASGYPRRLEDLANGVEDGKDPLKKKIYFLRRLPRDPMYPAGDEPVAAAQTWGKRSYDSPPDQPREGEDVFDVYSLSSTKGLNGIPYNQW